MKPADNTGGGGGGGGAIPIKLQKSKNPAGGGGGGMIPCNKRSMSSSVNPESGEEFNGAAKTVIGDTSSKSSSVYKSNIGSDELSVTPAFKS